MEGSNHGVIYDASWSEARTISVDLSFLSGFFSFAALISFLLGTLLILLYFLPAKIEESSRLIFQTATVGQAEIREMPQVLNPTYQPQFDPTLPKENYLVIPSIGVDGEINEAPLGSYEEALRKGIWRVSDFGTPEARGRPIILAAHRFGYLSWSNLFRRENSFFNLPKLKVGDVVEIDWTQRKYVYEIYKEDKGTQISDYSPDLILYTCELLNSDVRIFKYARLLEI